MRFWTRCTIVVLSVCVAVTALPGKDIVLCIGPSGHVALEFAQNGRCDEGPCRPVGETPRAPGMDRSDHACGDCLSCVDIPLSQGPVAGPSSVSGAVKQKSCSPVLSALLPAGLARDSFGTTPCASLSPPDGGRSLSFPSRVLRI